MAKRLALSQFLPFLFLMCLSFSGASPCAGGDYFYSSGKQCPLTRLDNVRAAIFPPAATFSLRAVRQAGSDIEVWERHGVVLSRSARAIEVVKGRFSQGGSAAIINPVFDYGSGEPLVVTDEFIACFPEGVSRAEIDQINARYGAKILRTLSVRPNTYVLSAGAEPLAALRLANIYMEQGVSLFAHPNFVARKKKRFSPNDPYFPHQWHLNNIGQNGALPGHDVEAPPAWDITRGDPGVIIAVIDDGVEFSHEDLQGDKFVPGHDFYDNDSDPSAVPSNEDFHGTAVIGVTSANGDNGTGTTGMAPGCRVMPLRLICGETSDEQDSNAIHWAAENGAWIISNSWGPPDGNPFIAGDEMVHPLPDIVRAAIDYAADEGRGGKGCVIFWAAGNGNEPVGYDGYASYGKVIAVGACDARGIRSYYSDYGPELDICAPSDGSDPPGIWTLDLMGSNGYNSGSGFYGDASGNYTNDFGGTSSATPLAAGVAALLLSCESYLTREEIQERLQRTADRVDMTHANYDLSGRSALYGYGRVNAFSALTERGRFPRLSLSAQPNYLRQGGSISLNFSILAGRVPSVNVGDGYLLLVPPAGSPLYVNHDYTLTTKKTPFIRRVRVADRSGPVVSAFTLRGAPPGRYTVYAAIVQINADPLLPSSWLHTPASATFDYSP
ncbi:MAG: S8 family serine peptidase [Candidatus Aureabacteria bacterium]|nr:S8 family serine peptidase [Candidatus Auribacterota bacterium]